MPFRSRILTMLKIFRDAAGNLAILITGGSNTDGNGDAVMQMYSGDPAEVLPAEITAYVDGPIGMLELQSPVTGGVNPAQRVSLKLETVDGVQDSAQIEIKADAIFIETSPFGFTLDNYAQVNLFGSLGSQVQKPITDFHGAHAPAGAATTALGVGIALFAPVGGAVEVDVSGFVRANVAGTGTYLSFEFREGDVIGAGAIISAVSTNTGMGNYNTQFVGGTRSVIIEGLAVHGAYNVRLFAVSGAGGAVFSGAGITVKGCL